MTKNCLVCNKEFRTNKSRLKTGRGKFCSKKCKGIWQSENITGENNHNWRGGKTEKICLICNGKFNVSVAQIKGKKGKFCSRKCCDVWRKQNIIGENHHNWKGGKVKKICSVCNKEFSVKPSQIKKGHGRFCSRTCAGADHSRKISGKNNPFWGIRRTGKNNPMWGRSQKGKNNGNWKGGITPENHRIRTSTEYNEWRMAVYERDNFACQRCGNVGGGNLHAHHILGFAKYPKIRFNIDNGITLCVDCHGNLHGKNLDIRKKVESR